MADLLRTLVAGRGWGEQIALGRLRDEWNAVVGEHIAGHCEPLRIQRGVLTIRADGGTWATELTLLAAKLATKVDGFLGGGLVSSVKVVAGGASARG